MVALAEVRRHQPDMGANRVLRVVVAHAAAAVAATTMAAEEAPLAIVTSKDSAKPPKFTLVCQRLRGKS
jgi:hypothetical protein